MMRATPAACIVFALLLACSGTGDLRGRVEPASPASPLSPPPPESDTATTRPLPPPDASLPRGPGRVAAAIRDIEAELNDGIARWKRAKTPLRTPLARAILLRALYRQRIYRHLAAHPRLEAAVAARLPRRLRSEVAANVAAGRALGSLVAPQPGPVTKHKIHRPPSASTLLRMFKRAERRFGVAWEVLAAVMLVESKFARILGPSSAGALGPMQFIPSTWEAYGLGGNPMDPRDSIMGAANYLRASGAPTDLRSALFAYNRAQAYVDAVILYARQIERDPRNYYDYYNWQVFYATTRGPVLLRGPELRGL